MKPTIELKIPGVTLREDRFHHEFPAEDPFIVSYEDGDEIKFTCLNKLRERGHTCVRLRVEDGYIDIAWTSKRRLWKALGVKFYKHKKRRSTS